MFFVISNEVKDLDRMQHDHLSDGLDSLPLHSVPLEGRNFQPGSLGMPLPQKFKAMVVSEAAEKTFPREIRERALSDLPAGELIIEVKYSSLNYKDALSATGNKGVTRKYPHTPGVDAAGVVVDSTNRIFAVGDQVIVTGFDLGMNTPGGFGQYISVPSGWAVKLPQGLSLRD